MSDLHSEETSSLCVLVPRDLGAWKFGRSLAKLRSLCDRAAGSLEEKWNAVMPQVSAQTLSPPSLPHSSAKSLKTPAPLRERESRAGGTTSLSAAFRLETSNSRRRPRSETGERWRKTKGGDSGECAERIHSGRSMRRRGSWDW